MVRDKQNPNYEMATADQNDKAFSKSRNQRSCK